jgi:hypothetical protein
MPEAATTLLEMLDWHVKAHPQQVQITVLIDDAHVQIKWLPASDRAC